MTTGTNLIILYYTQEDEHGSHRSIDTILYTTRTAVKILRLSLGFQCQNIKAIGSGGGDVENFR